MKLIITDTDGPADFNYEIDCPFEKEDVFMCYLEDWQNRQIDMYTETAGGEVSAKYDFELDPDYIREQEKRQAEINSDQADDDRVKERLCSAKTFNGN